ncbi:hypothetical protein N5U55_11475 [Aliarcobacter butzleri]|uniref:hypothetical protein n=1 Tax=Aliarcobacter butzleri TaxID=28197 RepID=UPI0021B1CD43|nr:hypothetical protein [Aliarcobacter butzleri]MCT7584717.1 hypothetical protein [Aliarcobacter butzleri]
MKIKKNLLYGDNPITNYLPEIEKEDINGIMYLISNLSNRFLEHKFDNNCLSISKDMKYDLFSQNRWRQIIDKKPEHVFHKLFQLRFYGNNLNQATNGYQITKLLIDSYCKWLSYNPTYELIEVNKKQVRIKDIQIDEEVDETKSNFYEEVEINIEYIKKKLIEYWEPVQKYLDKETVEADAELFKFIKYKIEPLRKMYYYISENNNKLKIYYRQSHSGRYYSIGEYSIQSLKKEVRNIILNDYNEYDISVSAPLLLSQIYKSITNENIPSTIKYFIINKKRIREIFAEKYNISLDKSKEFFTSLFFGSKLLSNDFKYNSAVTKSLGIDIVNLILSDKTTYEYQLYKDIKKLFDVISVGTQRIWPPRAFTLGQLTHNDLAS